MNENPGKDKIKGEVTPLAPASKQTPAGKQDLRKLLIKLAIIISAVVVLLLLVSFIVALIKGTDLSYEKMEGELKEAAIKYYKVQTSLLPTEEGGTDEVDASVLASSEYMKPLSKLNKKTSCTGKVVVQKVKDNYVYTPYLECGDAYVTKELYKAVLEQGVTTTGNGLYEANGEYVYRGEFVNNYLQLDQALYRIVKVKSDHKIQLILEDVDTTVNYAWDNRYNNENKYTSGLNDYHVSRMHDFLDVYYKKGYKEKTILSDNDRDKLIGFDLCIGARSAEETNNSGAVECAAVMNDQMIGLLTVNDFINASVDSTCQKALDKSCQNYNYLFKEKTTWWLQTPSPTNNSDLYYVTKSGYIKVGRASSSMNIRPVIMLNSNVMIKNGKGTLAEPYVLK